MKLVRVVLLLPLLVLVLTGCTGTSENIPPLLLAVGRVDPGNVSHYQMVLVEDSYPNTPTTTSRLTVLSASAQALTYAPVDADVVDRLGTRNAMVVLTRDVKGGTAPASALVTFNLAQIDPSTPSAFKETSRVQLTGGANPLLGTSATACFTGLTVSRDGTYVTLLDDPQACGDSGGYARLFQVDTATNQVTPVTLATGVQQTVAAVPFDDQADVHETLYFLQYGPASDAFVYSAPVPFDMNQAQRLSTLPTQQQIALKGAGSQLVTVTNSDRYNPLSTGTSDIQTFDPTALNLGATTSVQAINGARTFAVDPSGATPQLILANHQQVAIYSDPTTKTSDVTPSNLGYSGVAATIDPVNRFAYLVGENRILIFDLIAQESQTGSWYPQTPPPPITLDLPKDATGRYVTAVAWTRATTTTP